MGLDTVELVNKIEDHFSIRFTNKEAEQLVTVQDFYNAVQRHLDVTPAQMSATRDTINNIIADHAGVDLEEIQPHKSITSDLGLD